MRLKDSLYDKIAALTSAEDKHQVKQCVERVGDQVKSAVWRRHVVRKPARRNELSIDFCPNTKNSNEEVLPESRKEHL